jgi:hypothetical protein
MIAMDTATLDLEASLKNCKTQRAECDAKLEQQQKLLSGLQQERATFALAQERREQAEAAFRPQVKAAHEKFLQAQDYTKSAKGTVKQAARDEELAAKTHYNEMRAQHLDLTKQHQSEAEADQPFIDEIESKIRSAKLVISQLEAQQTALRQTHDRLHAEVGQARYEVLSPLLRQPREKLQHIEAEQEQVGDIYAQLRAESFPQLDEWPHLKRKLQEENDIADNTVENALTLFANLCEMLAKHPIHDPEIARLLIFETIIWDEFEGTTSTKEFKEQALLVRWKLAELNHEKR